MLLSLEAQLKTLRKQSMKPSSRVLRSSPKVEPRNSLETLQITRKPITNASASTITSHVSTPLNPWQCSELTFFNTLQAPLLWRSTDNDTRRNSSIASSPPCSTTSCSSASRTWESSAGNMPTWLRSWSRTRTTTEALRLKPTTTISVSAQSALSTQLSSITSSALIAESALSLNGYSAQSDTQTIASGELIWGSLLDHDMSLNMIFKTIPPYPFIKKMGFWGFGEIGRASCRERVWFIV